MPAESSIIKTINDGSITFTTGDGTSLVLPCSITMDISSLQANQREAVAIEARGVLKSLRQGARVYPSGTVEMYLTGLSDATLTTELDLIFGTGSYSSTTSTTTALGDLRTVDIKLTIEGTDLGDAADHTFTLEDCYLVNAVSEAQTGDTISAAFTCYGTVTRV